MQINCKEQKWGSLGNKGRFMAFHGGVFPFSHGDRRTENY